MASMTCCGTCVPPGPSRKTAGCPLTVCASAGNCERTQMRSSAVDEDEACSAIGIADILIESVEADVEGWHERRRIRCPGPLEGQLISEKLGIAEAMP